MHLLPNLDSPSVRRIRSIKDSSRHCAASSNRSDRQSVSIPLGKTRSGYPLPFVSLPLAPFSC